MVRFGLCKRLLCALAIGTTLIVGAVGVTAGPANAWSGPEPVDQSGTQMANPSMVACPSASFCIGLGDSGADPGAEAFVYHLSPTGTPSAILSYGEAFDFGQYIDPDSEQVNSLQCPSVSLCVSEVDYDDIDYVTDPVDVVSIRPAAGLSSWIEQHLTVPFGQISCPTASICVGAGDGDIIASTDPAGGVSAWTTTALPAGSSMFSPGIQIGEVACSSADFCAAVDSDGDVWTSTDPTGGDAAWSEAGASAPLKGVSQLACSAPDLCVAATGKSGSVLVSTDPAGSTAWTSVSVSSNEITALDCVPGVPLCLAGDSQGAIATSQDGVHWSSVQTADSHGIGSLSCTAQTCVASPRASPDLPLLATVPTTGAAWQWNALTAQTRSALSGISCPAVNDCVGASQYRYYTSANPARRTGSWHFRIENDQFHDRQGQTFDTSCYSATACLAVIVDQGVPGGLYDSGNVRLYRFDPVGGAHDFQDITHGLAPGGLYVTCAQGTCVAGDPSDGWSQSSDPARSSSWHNIKDPRFDVTCLERNRRCVALAAAPFSGDAGPDLLVAAKRSGPWMSQTIDPGGEITGLACTPAGACVVVDQGGQLLVSNDPTAGPAAWHLRDTDLYGFNGVACENDRTCVAVDNNGGIVVGRL